MKQCLSLCLMVILAACAPFTPVVGSAPPLSSDAGAGPAYDPAVYTDYAAGPLQLRLYAPQDMAETTASPLTLIARAPEGTVVSINEEILLIGTDGWVQTQIDLVEGPNLIEVVASDLLGNEIAFTLTVFYQP